MNIKAIVKNIKKQSKEEDKLIKERVKKAEREINLLTKDFLKIDPEIKKIILFGSLINKDISSINFDIDLALESNEYLKLVARALNSDFKVDLIDLKTINPFIKKNILKYGKIIYEKK